MENNKTTIDANGTILRRSLTLEKMYGNFLFQVLFSIIWIFGFLSVIYLGAGQFYYKNEQIIGLALIFLALFLYFLARRSFFFRKVLKPNIIKPKDAKAKISAGEKINLFALFSLDLARATLPLFSKEKKEAKATELALAASESKELIFISSRLGLRKPELQNYIKSWKNESMAVDLILQALDSAISFEHDSISSGDIFYALCSDEKFIKPLSLDLKIDLKDIENLIYWQTAVFKKREEEKDWLNPEHLKLTGGIGRDWAYGFTNFLRQYSIDLTEGIRTYGLNLEIIGRDAEIREIEEALIRRSNRNVVVVGDAGVGKKTVIMGFAKRVLEGEVPSPLANKHIFQLDVDAILTDRSENFVPLIEKVLFEAASAGNVIIFIENVARLLSEGDGINVNIAQILTPYLNSSEVNLICTSSIKTYNDLILANENLNQGFVRVSVTEPDKENMIRIIEDTLPHLEYETGSYITYEAIKTVIEEADKYILNLPNPEKTINLLEGAITKATDDRGSTVILPKDIDAYVSEKYRVPVGEIKKEEKSKLLNLEEELHKSVIGQNEAINALAGALRRARAGVENSKKPIGSFLFLGPTGVGKTETAKALARSYFGGEDRIIRFDMSEYQNSEDLTRFIGAGAEDSAQNSLATAIREKPFSLLLFDEIEKANKNILDLFLQILDEGFLTDSLGKKVSFSNSIIICTSNAGANMIRESIKDPLLYEKIKQPLIDYLVKENIYRPEFINRFTQVITFSPLSQQEITEVAKLLIKTLKKDVMNNRGIKFDLEPDVLNKLAMLGYDPQMGARPMKRVIEEKIENFLAKKILADELKKGDSIMITAEMVK